MKAEIHPEYYPEARVTCACGNSFTVGATVSEINTEVCSSCHPFFTGEQRIVDTAGQVERFMRRLEAGEAQRRDKSARRDERRRKELDAKRKRRGLTPLRSASESPEGETESADDSDVDDVDVGDSEPGDAE
jgi:large subunit ribosomal protein L31